MLFNSLDFALFLPLVFFIYWFVANKNLKLQNLLIVSASYVFYGWWDWRFLSLILFSTLVDFLVGISLSKQKNPTRRKVLLWISVIANLGLLGYFKYFNFFLDSFVTAFSFFGLEISSSPLKIILPVGISFYTFQTLSYTVDVYKKKIEPTKDLLSFAAFVSFFPQLVAGPIERAKDLLPQFQRKRKFDYSKAIDGSKQILWGLFKKVVIADNCATIVDDIFYNAPELNGLTLLICLYLFMFQLYGDFSGYSDIAIGTARLFGFNLKKNFAYPFFSRTVPELWRRWHISLTTWFRDYLFLPLVRKFPINNFTKVANVFILFLAIGVWHGANWNFVLWGFYLALIFIPSMFLKKERFSSIVAKNKLLPNFRESIQIFITFQKIAFAMIFFRAQTFKESVFFIKEIFSFSLFNIPIFSNDRLMFKVVVLILLFMLIEWLGRENNYGIEKLGSTWKKPFRITLYYALVFSIFWFAGQKQEFIYFEF